MRKERTGHITRAMRSHSLVAFLVIALVAFGIFSLPQMNKDEFPQFVIRQAIVAAIYPGATAEEVEQQVTKPLEQFLFTYQEIDKERTYSKTENGAVYIYAMLRNEVPNNDVAWSKIRHGLELFKVRSLPRGVAAVAVVDDFGNTSSMLLAVESDERSPRELEEYARVLCDRLRSIPAMGNIKVLGKQHEEVAVYVDEEQLSHYSVDPKVLTAELAMQGFRTMTGSLDNKSSEALVHVVAPYRSEYELGEQVVYVDPAGHSVKLRDIARIERCYSEPAEYVEYYDNEVVSSGKKPSPCVIVSVEMFPGNNIVQFGSNVDKVLAQTRAELPPDLRFYRITDQPKVVGDSVMSFLRDLLLSMLVVIMVMMLLFPLRTALVACTSVPVCTAVAIGLMYLIGIELNTVTLAALIVVLGMIVDDSVIVIDGYTEKLERGHSAWYSAVTSTETLFVPMSIATLAISGMFFPMTHIITGPLGDFVQLFPWAVLFALTASIFYAVWVIPYMSAVHIRKRSDVALSRFEKGQNVFFDFLQNGYNKLLRLCFSNPKGVLCSALVLLCFGGFLFTRLNVQMMPKAERENFAVEIHLTEGSSLQQTALVADSMARILQRDERVLSVTSFVGCSSPRFNACYAPQMARKNYAQFIVVTENSDATAEVLRDYSDKYENLFPNAYIRFKQLDYQAVNNPLEVYVKGDDWSAMEKVSDTIKWFLNRQPELTWVHSDYDETMQDMSVRLKPEEAVQFGLTQTMLSLYLSSALGGQQMTGIWEDDYRIPVVLHAQGADSLSYQELENLLIPTSVPSVWVPLRQVATIEPMWHHGKMTHRNGVRTITVGADMRGNNPQPKSMKKLQKFLDTLNLPEGVTVSPGGLTDINGQVIPQLVMSVIAAILVMFALLLFHFGKLSVALLALASSVLTIFGSFLGLWIFRLDFSITALLGIVSLIGIIVRNAIIMYEYAEQLRHEGKTAREAAMLAGKRRMRPIFLTSATTALGVIPMIIAHTSLWMPMGVVICFGTLFTLPLVVTVLPIAYWRLFDESHSWIKPRRNISVRTVAVVAMMLIVPLSQAQTLSLDSCLSIAHSNSTKAKNAQIDLMIAQETKNQAFTKYFPQVQAVTGGFYSANPMVELGIDGIKSASVRDMLNLLYANYGVPLGVDKSVGYLQKGVLVGLVATQPVFTGGQIYHGNKLAQLGVEAAKEQQHISEHALDDEVEEAFWLVYSLEQKAQMLVTVQKMLETISDDVRNAVTAGLAVRNDLIKVEIQQNTIMSQMLNVESGTRLAKYALCQAIGILPTDSFNIDVPEFYAARLPNYKLESEAVIDRPEARLLKLNVEAEELRKRMSIGQAMPQILVGAGYSYNNLFNKNANNGTIFFTATVPLSAWWETSSKIRQHNLQIIKAENTQADFYEKMVLETRRQWNELNDAYRRLSIMKNTVDNAKENLRISQLNYNAGLITLSEYLQAQTLYSQALDQQSEAKTQYLIAQSRYNRLTQQ